MLDFIYIFYNKKSCTYLRWSSTLKQMFITPIQELDEIVTDHAQTQSTNDEPDLQEQPRADDVDEEERDDPPKWGKWK